ncbi:MAG TPA: hypothetical protein VIG90_07805 [Pedomonas sp.]|uniref:hypothetical protein n=1 Tax=Pedomonas sp. TaxID=2976421 RepID=UPI002F3F7717
MTRWSGVCRSNYVKVKDPAAFRTFLADFRVELLEKDGLYGFAVDTVGNRPGTTGHLEEHLRELCNKLPQHLAPGQVCVVFEVGCCGRHYLTGWSKAIHYTGEMIMLDLDEIYALAMEKFGRLVAMTAVEF